MKPLLITFALAALLSAQQPQQPEAPQIRTSVVNVQVPVVVQAKNDKKYVDGLKAEDFQLFDNGVPQTFRLDAEDRPVSMVVAVQANNAAAAVLGDVRRASALLSPLVAGQGGEIAVLSFDHRVQTLSKFTSSSDQIKAAFEQLQAGSAQHHLDDAITEGIRLLRTRAADRRKVLLVISEDFDRGSSQSTRQVFEEAEFNGIVVYAVSMKLKAPLPPVRPRSTVPPENRPPLPMGNQQTITSDVQNGGYAPTVSDIIEIVRGVKARNSLEAYTEMSGGRTLEFKNARGLETAFETIGRDVHHQYVLTFAPQDASPGHHALAVQVRNVPDKRVRARRSYRVDAGPAPPAR